MTKSCLNCNSEISANFCSNCGQKATVHQYSFQHFVQHDLIHGIWHVDSGILFTIKALFTSPGHSIREFIQGRRVKYFNYISLLVIIIGVSHFIGNYATIKMTDIINSGNDFAKELEAFTTKYPKINLLLTIPFYAVISNFWFKKAKLNLTEHFVLNSYKSAGEFLILGLFTLITVFYSDKFGLSIVLSIVSLASYIYSVWFYKQFFSVYGYSNKAILFRSILCIISYFFIITIIGILIGFIMLLKNKVI